MSRTRARIRRGRLLTGLIAGVALLAPAAPAAQAAPAAPSTAVAAVAADGSFYRYDGSTPLADLAPGTVLKTRTLPYHVVGVPLPLSVVQVLYRTTDQQGRAVANVTSVIKPIYGSTSKVVSYQSFYDSLNPEDGPSRSIAGNVSLGGAIANFETTLLAPLLLQGYAVVVADTEGPTADFAAGPEYGQVTLDSLRATFRTPGTGIAAHAKVGLIGYSGGAIATNWAAVLAPSYAPDVNARLVGAAEGGILVQPSRNLAYVDGSALWAGIMPAAIVGVSRAFGIDLTPYLSEYGLSVYEKLQKASIVNVIGSYPGLTWKKLTKPEYADPASIPVFVDTVNQLNLGARPSPTVPVLLAQGAGGELEGTSGSTPGAGKGDGVMVAGDVRSLARQYCADGVRVTHREYPLLSHVAAAVPWVAETLVWLGDRFAGRTAPSNCAGIAPGNPLTPLQHAG